jgi:hypothetical protein
MDLLKNARSLAAEGPKAKVDETEWLAGPFPVGHIGVVGVISRDFNGNTYPYARFVPVSGRPSNMSLAACEAVIDGLRQEAEAEEAPEAPEAEEAPEATEED